MWLILLRTGFHFAIELLPLLGLLFLPQASISGSSFVTAAVGTKVANGSNEKCAVKKGI
jgi:hypothetical protein